MIRLSGELICATDEETALVSTYLPDHLRLSRVEPGCLSFDVTRSADPLVWKVEERFTTRDAFEAHQVRTRASLWFERTGHIRRSYRVVED